MPLSAADIMRAFDRLAAELASELDLPDDWLNDAAKGCFVGVTVGVTSYETPTLHVRAATIVQLLAMKSTAWRDGVDRGDARLLLSEMEGLESMPRSFVFAKSHGPIALRKRNLIALPDFLHVA